MISDHKRMKLESNSQKDSWDIHTYVEIKHVTRKSRRVQEEAARGVKTLKDVSEGKHQTPKPWGAAKAVLRGKLIAVSDYMKKEEGSQINNSNFPFKKLEEP